MLQPNKYVLIIFSFQVILWFHIPAVCDFAHGEFALALLFFESLAYTSINISRDIIPKTMPQTQTNDKCIINYSSETFIKLL
jgi:hypothetical protein